MDHLDSAIDDTTALITSDNSSMGDIKSNGAKIQAERSLLQRIDQDYMSPVFGGPTPVMSEANDKDILVSLFVI